jgi:hypothetical protein
MTVVERLIREHRRCGHSWVGFLACPDGCYLRVSSGALQKETVVEGLGRLVAGLQAIL